MNQTFLSHLPLIESQTFIMRPIKLADYIDLYDYGKDLEVVKYLSWDAFKSLKEAKEALQNVFLNRPSMKQPAAYAIVHKRDHKMIGTCDFLAVDFHKQTAKIGFCLHRRYWQKGIMSQALHALMEVGFVYFRFKTLYISHLSENIVSRRVIEKNHFNYQKTVFENAYNAYLKHYYLDRETYLTSNKPPKNLWIDKVGYQAFNKPYSVMLKNDTHAKASVDHRLLRTMVRLDTTTKPFFYEAKLTVPRGIEHHTLYPLAQSLKANKPKDTIVNILNFTKTIAKNAEVSLDEMIFGGTEEAIIKRKTDWCGDLSRVGITLLMCAGIPARMVYLANLKKAYHGHVVGEAYYDKTYGLLDFVHGINFYQNDPLSAYDALSNDDTLYQLALNAGFNQTHANDYVSLYQAVAISDYNPCNPHHDYSSAKINDYYRNILTNQPSHTWFQGEEKPLF